MIRLLFFVFICIAVQLEAQTIKKRNIPEAVKTSVLKLYPDATKIEWSKDDSLYEASFSIEDIETELLLKANGLLVMTERDIDVSALPATITDYIKRHLHASVIDEASIRTDVNGVVSYEVEVENTEYLFTSDGKMVSTEAEDDEEKD